MLNELLAGVNGQSQKRLNALCKQIGNEPRIAWYPSAGNDYRDLMELCTIRALQQNVSEEPDVFFHTDYHIKHLKSSGIIYDDSRTRVVVENTYHLSIRKKFNYFVNPEYAVFHENAPESPLIWLLDVSVHSDIYGVVNKPVIYFVFENINFFDEFILKNMVPITYFVKIREGCGFGGNRKSISIVYAFLSVMKTRYLLVDNRTQTDFWLVDHLMEKHNLGPENYCLEKTHTDRWSEMDYSTFKVTFEKDLNGDLRAPIRLNRRDGFGMFYEKKLSMDALHAILKTISNK